jgi:hypothetical protein
MPTAAAGTGSATNAILATLSAAGLIIGSLMPWATVTALGFINVSVSGMQGGGDGYFTIGAGLVLLLCGLRLFSHRFSRGASNTAFFVALLAAALTAYELTNVARVASNTSSQSGALASVSSGPGLYLALIGSILGVASIFFRPTLTTAVVPPVVPSS